MYKSYFSPSAIRTTYDVLKSNGTYHKTKKRNLSMYMYGSTCTASQFPQYYKDGKHHTLPRPYESSKPGHSGHRLMHCAWFTELVSTIEDAVKFFLEELHPNKEFSEKILETMREVENIVPNELRISNSIFTHLTVLGDLKDGSGMLPHLDEKDIITAIFHVGFPSEGGSTNYYNGLSVSESGKKVKEIIFKHGRLQIGQYNNVIHGVDAWKGERGCLIFNTKETILNHFREESDYYYKQYQRNGFPSGPFLAI